MAEAPTLIVGKNSEEDICIELLRLESVYVAWETWVNVGLLYARRRQTSPPLLVRADNTAQIWEQVREAERRIAARRNGAPPLGDAGT